MSELEELMDQFMILTSEAEVNMEKIKALRKEYNELIEAESKPEYPDGTFGRFSDVGTFGPCGFLKNEGRNLPYQMHNTPELDDQQYERFKYFTPLPEAILPHPVENTGTCPWKDGDEVRVELSNGDFETDTVPINWAWRKNIRLTHIVRSQLIKRAGE